jgi:hypothetical protein
MMISWRAAMIAVPLLLGSANAIAQAPPATNSLPVQSAEFPAAPVPIRPMAGRDRLALNLVNCGGWVDCLLAKLVLPSSMQIDTHSLCLENDGSESIAVAKTVAIAQGQQTGAQLSDSALGLQLSPQPLLGGQITPLALQVNRQGMPPDHYDGNLYVMLGDRNQRLTLPVLINVRGGPLPAIAALLLGVVLGRLLQYMQRRGEPQADRLKQVNQLEADVSRLDPDDQSILAPMLLQVRQQVFREALAEADAQLALLHGRLQVLQTLRQIQARLEGDRRGIVDPFLPQLERVRLCLSEANDEAAKTELTALQAELAGVRGDGAIAELATAVGQAAAPLEAKAGHITPAARPWHLASLRRRLIGLAGLSNEVRAEATLWVVRPLFAIGLLVGLALMGLNELYIEKGDTLGAKPFTDYWGLILWGLSADVASRSLGSLKDPSNP